METIRVFHTEDYQIMRDGIRYLLGKDPHIKFVGEARSGEQMLSRLRSLDVDVLILDIYLDAMEKPKEMNGFEICEIVRQQYPNIRILAHSVYDDADKVARIIRAGAMGYVSKKSGFEELTHAVKEVFAGRIYICNDTAHKLKNLNNFLEGIESNLRSKGELFSAREREVLNLLAQGLSSKDISVVLGITERTVETHRKNMIAKAHIKNTAELIAYAASLGLILK
jgi:DNA-binding NarL/FixJ family response regulator